MMALDAGQRTCRTHRFSSTELMLCRNFPAPLSTANLISGGIDEIFTRADSTGSFTPLKDALGSTIALVDASGKVWLRSMPTIRSATPQLSGATNSNAFQYTGRENEGNGLYFYRARYYSPLLGRFINEDPLGFAGSGSNFYAYVFDSPTNLTDPFGLAAPALVPLAAGGGAGLTLIQGGGGAAAISGTVVETGSMGGPLGVGVAATGAIVYFGASASNAELNANAAYDEEWQSVIAYNQAMMAKKKPFTFAPMPLPQFAPGTARGNPYPLAGRYSGGDDGGNDDCPKRWTDARRYCSGLSAMPRRSPEWKNYKNIWGGNYDRCVKGQVPERCGGSLIEY